MFDGDLLYDMIEWFVEECVVIGVYVVDVFVVCVLE